MIWRQQLAKKRREEKQLKRKFLATLERNASKYWIFSDFCWRKGWDESVFRPHFRLQCFIAEQEVRQRIQLKKASDEIAAAASSSIGAGPQPASLRQA